MYSSLRQTWKIVMLALLSLFVISCGGGGGGGGGTVTVDKIPPTVSTTNPADGATDVPAENSITITFSESMNATSIDKTTFIVKDASGAVSGNVSCSGAIATFTPTTTFAYNTQYWVTAKAGVKDRAGNAMLNDHAWTFSTGPDTTNPTVTSTDPVKSATGVAINIANITAAFSEVIDCTKLDLTTFTLSGVTGTVGCSGNIATFSPSTNLSYGTIYTATLKSTITDLALNPLGSDYTWTFSTSSGTGAPYITETTPANGEVGVCLDDYLFVKFSEDINHSTLVANSTFLLDSPGGLENGSISMVDSPTWAWYYPDSDLPRNTPFTASITTGVTDLAGNPMESNFSWNFTTTWTTLLGTTREEEANSIAVGQTDDVYIAGFTKGDLVSSYGNFFSQDIFVAKYKASGALEWVDQLGDSNLHEEAMDIAVDAFGNAYVTGVTDSSLDGQTHAGSRDIFLMKYNAAGSRLWTALNGTWSSDLGYGVAISGNDLFVVGSTGDNLNGNTSNGGTDSFVSKFDQNGVLQWTVLNGSADTDSAYAVALDASGNIFVAGDTSGDLNGNTNIGGNDFFLTKFDSSGNHLWTVQDGTTALDHGYGVAVNSLGNPIVVGSTEGSYADGATTAEPLSPDFFVAIYNGTTGALIWKHQLGVPKPPASITPTEANDVAVDSNDNIYVAGYSSSGATAGLDGNISSGGREFFITKYDKDGIKQWTKLRWGSHGEAHGAVVDSSDRIYLTGFSEMYPSPADDLCGAPHVGMSDAFIMPYNTNGNNL